MEKGKLLNSGFSKEPSDTFKHSNAKILLSLKIRNSVENFVILILKIKIFHIHIWQFFSSNAICRYSYIQSRRIEFLVKQFVARHLLCEAIIFNIDIID